MLCVALYCFQLQWNFPRSLVQVWLSDGTLTVVLTDGAVLLGRYPHPTLPPPGVPASLAKGQDVKLFVQQDLVNITMDEEEHQRERERERERHTHISVFTNPPSCSERH